MYLIMKVSYLCDVNSKEAIDEVMAEYGKRFPHDLTKGNHANKLAGGIDLKDEVEN